MISTRPNIDPDALYPQAEAARLLEVDRHTLLRWERDPSIPLEGFIRRSDRAKVYKGKALLKVWGGVY